MINYLGLACLIKALRLHIASLNVQNCGTDPVRHHLLLHLIWVGTVCSGQSVPILEFDFFLLFLVNISVFQNNFMRWGTAIPIFVCVEVLRPGQPNGVILSAGQFTLPHFSWAGLVI